MKHLFLILVFVGAVATSFAGSKDSKTETTAEKAVLSISGEITDQATQEALVGVKVTLEGTDKVAYTDFDGKYSFESLAPGTYNLTASYISYQKSSVKNVELSLNTNQVDISLKASN